MPVYPGIPAAASRRSRTPAQHARTPSRRYATKAYRILRHARGARDRATADAALRAAVLAVSVGVSSMDAQRAADAAGLLDAFVGSGARPRRRARPSSPSSAQCGQGGVILF